MSIADSPDSGSGSPPRAFTPTLLDVVLSGVATLLLLVLAFVFFGLVSSRSPLTGPDGVDQALVIAALAAQAAAMIGAVYFLVMRRRRIGWTEFGLRPISRAWLIGSAVAGVLCITLVSVIVAGLQEVLGLPRINPQAGILAPEGFTWPGLILMLLFGGLVVPFAEEVMFRGLLYPWLRRFLPLWPSALLSAALFGALHMQLEVAAGAFGAGILLALAYEKSGSLWPPVIIHSVQNSVAIAVMFKAASSG